MKNILMAVLDPIIGHWKFLKEYELSLHLGMFMLYNVFIVYAVIIWAIFNILLGIEVTRPLFDMLDLWFNSGYLLTAPAWRWHLVINFFIIIKCATYHLNNHEE